MVGEQSDERPIAIGLRAVVGYLLALAKALLVGPVAGSPIRLAAAAPPSAPLPAAAAAPAPGLDFWLLLLLLLLIPLCIIDGHHDWRRLLYWQQQLQCQRRR
jgi:hypothetical protein